MVRLDGFRELDRGLAGEVVDAAGGRATASPVYLVLYAGDAADTVLERSGTDALRTVLRFGPEIGVHTIGWWRSPQRLRSLLTLSASPDDLGAFVGLDVQGAELGTLVPGLPPSGRRGPAGRCCSTGRGTPGPRSSSSAGRVGARTRHDVDGVSEERHDRRRARYKDVIGELTAAADALRERDRARPTL